MTSDNIRPIRPPGGNDKERQLSIASRLESVRIEAESATDALEGIEDVYAGEDTEFESNQLHALLRLVGQKLRESIRDLKSVEEELRQQKGVEP